MAIRCSSHSSFSPNPAHQHRLLWGLWLPGMGQAVQQENCPHFHFFALLWYWNLEQELKDLIRQPLWIWLLWFSPASWFLLHRWTSGCRSPGGQLFSPSQLPQALVIPCKNPHSPVAERLTPHFSRASAHPFPMVVPSSVQQPLSPSLTKSHLSFGHERAPFYVPLRKWEFEGIAFIPPTTCPASTLSPGLKYRRCGLAGPEAQQTFS